jgi:hypothetical protein
MDDRRVAVRLSFSLLYGVQTGSGAQLPLKWVSGPISLGAKLQVHEADHSPPSNADVKKGGAIPSLPHTSSWYVKVMKIYPCA